MDRKELELGESLQFTLHMKVIGQLAFPPQMASPTFDGFEAHGPNQGQNISWVNGAVTIEQTWTWELVALKSGKLTLGPYTAKAKDALNGEIVKSTDPIVINVKRPRGLGMNGYNANAGAPPPEEEEPLRGIKPDRGLAWGLVAAGLGGFAALLGLLALFAHPRPVKKEILPPAPRDPGQYALEQLEKARQALAPGEETAFVRTTGMLLRDYLRQRQELGPEATLNEAMKKAARRWQGPWTELSEALRLSLSLVLYGGHEAEPLEADQAYAATRQVIIAVEQARRDEQKIQVELDKAQPTRSRPRRKG